MPPEAYSRVVIDQKLKDVGWNILDEHQVVFEDHGNVGRADYILKDKNGHAVALIEAKAPNIDPYSAKQQAYDYATAQYKNKIDYIYLANDNVIYFWDFAGGGDAYPVTTFYSQDDLHKKRLAKTRANVEPLTRKAVTADYFNSVDPSIKVRDYQLEAWEAVSKGYDSGKRNFLLEMATGTGKTVLAALMISKFIRSNQAQTVLFVVDRIELARQTRGTFEKYLAGISAVATYWGGSKKNLVGANVVVATIQSLIAHGSENFSPGYFDLIIHDEAHRSIYSPEAKAALDYFVGVTKIGLTATPKDFLKNIEVDKLRIDDPRAVEARIQRDTYKYFGCDMGQATYRYTIQDGVKNGYLVPPKLHKMTSILTQEALSDKGLVVEGDYENESYKINHLEKTVFVPSRNELMMKEFLEYAEKTPDGMIGKTIVFAVNQHHALELEKILNRLMPEYNGRFAQTITSLVKGAHDLARDFKKPDNNLPRVAVSVDMLTTGYDAPEVQNIVLARPVFEPTLYQQIKGRGTRLCPEINKKHFVVYDFCGVCEYFDEKYEWSAPLKVGKSGRGRDEKATQTSDETASTESRQAQSVEISVVLRPDMVNLRDQIVYGPDGDKIDREMYQNIWAKSVKEFLNRISEAERIIDDEEKSDELIKLINEELLNRPEYYFNEDNLCASHRIIAPIKDFFLSALGRKALPKRDDQINEWRQGMLEKYGIESGSGSQKKILMVRLIVEEFMKNKELLDSVIEKPNISFLQNIPFNQGYEVDEWLNTFGKETLIQMIFDIRNSRILRV